MLAGGVVEAGGVATGGTEAGGGTNGVCGGAMGDASLHAAAPRSAATASDLERVFIAAKLPSTPAPSVANQLSRSMVVMVARRN